MWREALSTAPWWIVAAVVVGGLGAVYALIGLIYLIVRSRTTEDERGPA